MSSWWMVNPGPKRQLISTIKKKFYTFFNLIVKRNYTSIIRTILNYIVIYLSKIGLLELPYLPYHILRYYNIVNKEFLLNKNHNFESDDDLKYFEKELINSKLYLEYGSGTSTIRADQKNINYYSIESDRNFYSSLKKKLKKKDNYFLKDFGVVTWASKPIFFFYRKFFIKKKAKKYANDILDYLEKKNQIPDLILIDGRYRILCALYVYKFLMKKNCTFKIIVDDFSRRPYLHIINNFLHGENVGSFGVFNKLKKCENIDELIDIYSYDYR